jgi:ABC-type glycerol-3-phosphate transport system substrate-binding protein
MKYLLLLSLTLPFLANCAGLALPTPPVTPEATGTPTLASPPTLEATQVPAAPTTLQVWVPPQFDPTSGTPAGRLLQARLDEFARSAEVRIDVRTKAMNGPGGLLDSLSAANAAAPLALPDLILLPRHQLEIAALKGLLSPYDNLITPLDEEDWYPYARQLGRLQNSTFGLPFAGDGQVLIYRPAKVSQPPADWPSTLTLAQPLVFPAADEQALFTLAQYLATGAPVQDSEGRPTLEPTALTDVLAYFRDAEAVDVMPFWITQFSTDDQAWEAYTEQRADQAITWISRYLSELPGDSDARTIPTADGQAFTLADGWVWALANPQVERHALSVELAKHLTAGDFLAEWTAEAGYLPPRASALKGWSNMQLRDLVGQIVGSAQVVPANDLMAVIGPALQLATVDVLKEQSDPATAARQAANSLAAPE